MAAAVTNTAAAATAALTSTASIPAVSAAASTATSIPSTARVAASNVNAIFIVIVIIIVTTAAAEVLQQLKRKSVAFIGAATNSLRIKKCVHFGNTQRLLHFSSLRIIFLIDRRLRCGKGTAIWRCHAQQRVRRFLQSLCLDQRKQHLRRVASGDQGC